MSKSALKPPRGMRDFYPDDFRRRAWLFDHFRSVVHGYAFEEVDADLFQVRCGPVRARLSVVIPFGSGAERLYRSPPGGTYSLRSRSAEPVSAASSATSFTKRSLNISACKKVDKKAVNLWRLHPDLAFFIFFSF